VVRIGLNGKWMSQPMKPTPVSAAGALLGPLPTSVTIGPLVGCAELPSVRRSSASWSRSRVQRGDVEPIDGVCRGVAAVEGPRLEALVEVLPRLRVQGGPRVPSFEPCTYQSRESRSGASFAETGASLAETTAERLAVVAPREGQVGPPVGWKFTHLLLASPSAALAAVPPSGCHCSL
jgi:hypothetical protein